MARSLQSRFVVPHRRLGVGTACAAAGVMILGFAGTPGAMAQPAAGARAARPVVYVEPTGPVTATEYADGRQYTYETETEWRAVCGSAPGALTIEDLERIAADHRKRTSEREQLVVVDSTPEGLRGAGLNIVFNINPTNAPAGYLTSFTQAEQYVESKFSDPITVTISVSWANLGSGVIGATGSNNVNNVSWTNSRNGLVNGMDPSDTIQSFLPAGSTIPVRFSATSAAVSNVSTVDWTRANYKATVGTVTGTDCSMQFNTAFTFDFDPTDGVTFGQTSLVDVIIHEVGHGLGFTSRADSETASDIRALDIFRFARTDRAGIGNTNPDTLAEFQTTAREVDFNSPGNEDANTDLIAAEYRMSDGDPYQASHLYQQSPNPAAALGIMQPAFASGVTFGPEYFRPADLAIFDAIGWDAATTPGCTPPTVTTQPTGLSRCAGASATFTVGGTGTPAPTRQWRKDGVNIPGATGFQLTIPSPTVADAGSYTCVLSNSCGSVASNAAVLTIVSCCPADADGNGAIQPADVAAFINTWFASIQDATLAGDFDGDGEVSPVDVATFVNAWFSALTTGC